MSCSKDEDDDTTTIAIQGCDLSSKYLLGSAHIKAEFQFHLFLKGKVVGVKLKFFVGLCMREGKKNILHSPP